MVFSGHFMRPLCSYGRPSTKTTTMNNVVVKFKYKKVVMLIGAMTTHKEVKGTF